jgi:hypothetical protein
MPVGLMLLGAADVVLIGRIAAVDHDIASIFNIHSICYHGLDMRKHTKGSTFVGSTSSRSSQSVKYHDMPAARSSSTKLQANCFE